MRTLHYVILHHTGVAEPHYDILIEAEPGGDLRTWRAAVWPVTAPTPLEALANHRRHYLTYEGDISGGRGTVRRVAGGTCEVTTLHKDQLIVRFDTGERLNLVMTDAPLWLALPME